MNRKPYAEGLSVEIAAENAALALKYLRLGISASKVRKLFGVTAAATAQAILSADED